MNTEPNFEDIETMPQEQIDAFLRECGYDPDQLKMRGKVIGEWVREILTLRQQLEAAQVISQMKWHWSLEKISQGSLGDRWIVWDENRLAVGDGDTPYRALTQALTHPLTDEQRKYSPRHNCDNLAFQLEAAQAEIKRLKRMVDWALKPETQKELQEEFDHADALLKPPSQESQ